MAILLLGAAGGAIVLRNHTDFSQRTFRIGFEHSPPDQVKLPDGSAGGPAIEIVREAARRRGIKLEWVHVPAGPEVALSSGNVDLWPLFNDLPGRRGRFFLGTPWCSRRFSLLVDQSSGIRRADQFGTRTIGVRYPGTNEILARVFLPGVHTLRERTFTEILREVCTGTAEGGLMWERLGRSTPIDPPPECQGHQFRYISIPNGFSYAGLAARLRDRQAQRAAAVIRDGISELGRDGTVSGIYFEWVNQSTDDTLVIDLLEAEKKKKLLLAGAVAVVFAIAAVVALQNLRIRAARKSAEEARDRANRATAVKSEFLANMSHEIRTPMNGMLGTCELLLETPLTDEQADYARTIQGCGRSLLDLINDILDLSKIEAGKLLLDEQVFQLDEVLESVFDLLAPKAREKRVDLFIQVNSPPHNRLRGDPLRIRQVLLNLAGNAVKFTQSGHVRILAECVFVEAGLRLKITVEDTGIGISPQALEKLFDKFTQADTSTTRKYGGTGLGLAIARELVELMGGTIGVSSIEGAGSRFWFELLLEMEDQELSRKTPLAGVRVAVLADTAAGRGAIAESLARFGANVTDIESGAVVVPGSCDVLVMDRSDPDDRPVECRIPGVCLSWHRREIERKTDFLALKPVAPSRLAGHVRNALSAGLANLANACGGQDETKHDPLEFAGERVLVVEDNPVNRKLAGAMLERWGCVVGAAASGPEALEMAVSQTWRLILMDCQMPQMDGFETTRRIKAALRSDTPPIVAVTARAMETDRQQCIAAGMDDYLMKPLSLDGVHATLRKWLAGKSPPGVPAHPASAETVV